MDRVFLVLIFVVAVDATSYYSDHLLKDHQSAAFIHATVSVNVFFLTIISNMHRRHFRHYLKEEMRWMATVLLSHFQ